MHASDSKAAKSAQFTQYSHGLVRYSCTRKAVYIELKAAFYVIGKFRKIGLPTVVMNRRNAKFWDFSNY